jgi:hypothetical protein
VSEREISPRALNAAFRRLRQEVSLGVQAPPVATVIKKSRARRRRRLVVAATASAATVVATVFVLQPGDERAPGPVQPAALTLSRPLVNGEPAGLAPGPAQSPKTRPQLAVTVTNTGDRALDDVTVNADGYLPLACDATSLGAGDDTTCSLPFTPEVGPQELDVRVSATDPDDQSVIDQITVFYQGITPRQPIGQPSIAVTEALVNGESAEAAPGPTVPTDESAPVEVIVTNSGQRPLESLTAGVAGGPDLTCEATELSPDDATTCSVDVVPEAGSQELDVRVNASTRGGRNVDDHAIVHFTGEMPQAPTAAFLSPTEANAALGSWTGSTWSSIDAVPPALQFPNSCAPEPMPDATEEALAAGPNAAISSTISLFPDATAAQQAADDAIEQVSSCVDAIPASDQLVSGLPAGNDTATAQLFGAVVGAGRAANQHEYVIVVRDGTAVEVCTFAAYAQDTLPEATLLDLANRVLDRLPAAG